MEAKHCFIQLFMGKVAANITVDYNGNISREKKIFLTPNLQLLSTDFSLIEIYVWFQYFRLLNMLAL